MKAVKAVKTAKFVLLFVLIAALGITSAFAQERGDRDGDSNPTGQFQIDNGRGDPPSGPDDKQTPPTPEQPPLCIIEVGFDPIYWASPASQVVYAALWFAAEPGTPIPAGTPAWGVAYVHDSISFPDANNIVAVTTNPATLQAAHDSGTPNLFNWPTPHGGVQSGDQIMYRLTNEPSQILCGPIVGRLQGPGSLSN